MFTAEQLRAARAILQMDQADLARASGVSVETIKRLERQTGKLHAKVETLIAIKKVFERQRLEFLGDSDGVGTGVRLAHPDKLQVLRETIVGEWADMLDQWLRTQCATDPKFFDRGAKRLTELLTKMSARISSTIARRLLSDSPKDGWGSVPFDAQRSRYGDRYQKRIPVGKHVSDLAPKERGAAKPRISTSALEGALAKYLTPTMLGLIEDATHLGAAPSAALIRAFVAAISDSECDGLTGAESSLSAEDLARAKNAVLAKVYDDANVIARITESTDDQVKSITTGLVEAAPAWAKFRAEVDAGRVRADLDLTSELMEAVRHIVEIRARGQNLEDYLLQRDAFDHLSDPVEAFVRMFYDGHRRQAAGPSQIAERLRFYVEEALIVNNDPRLDSGTLDRVSSREILSKVPLLRSSRRP
jgi:transcriptional regulator with XRE-family HTH domain